MVHYGEGTAAGHCYLAEASTPGIQGWTLGLGTRLSDGCSLQPLLGCGKGPSSIKEKTSACLGGIPSAGRSGTPGREVCCQCRPLRGARATPRILAAASQSATRPLSCTRRQRPLSPQGALELGTFLEKLTLRRGEWPPRSSPEW